MHRMERKESDNPVDGTALQRTFRGAYGCRPHTRNVFEAMHRVEAKTQGNLDRQPQVLRQPWCA